jgi:hypothetical protein
MDRAGSEKVVLTNSSISSFKTCARKYYWRYCRELELQDTAESLTLGSEVHRFLEGFYRQEPFVLDTGGLSPKATGILEGLSEAYPLLYADDFTLFDVVAVEKNLDGAILNPETGRGARDFRFGGKIDALVRMKADHYGFRAGDLVLLEHKTAARVDEAYLARLELDSQIRLYSLYLERELKIPIAGVLYNIILKPGIRPKKDETPGEFTLRMRQAMRQPEQYQRHQILIPAQQLDETERELWVMKSLIAAARKDATFPRNAQSCFNYSRQCDYYPLCVSADPEKEIAQSGVFRHRLANVELGLVESGLEAEERF